MAEPKTQTPTPQRNPTTPSNPNPNVPGDQSGKSGKTVPPAKK